MLTAFLIGILSILAGLDKLPYFIDRSLIAFPFFAVGYYCRNLILTTKEIGKGKLYLFAACCFAFIYFCATLSEPTRDTFFIHYLAGLSGIGMILSVSKALNKLPLISYIGRYSLVVLGFHTFLVGPMRFIFSFASPVGQYILSFIAIAILMRFLIIPISIKFFPYFTAQKDLIKLPNKE